jgi:hypothetical protein
MHHATQVVSSVHTPEDIGEEVLSGGESGGGIADGLTEFEGVSFGVRGPAQIGLEEGSLPIREVGIIGRRGIIREERGQRGVRARGGEEGGGFGSSVGRGAFGGEGGLWTGEGFRALAIGLGRVRRAGGVARGGKGRITRRRAGAFRHNGEIIRHRKRAMVKHKERGGVVLGGARGVYRER